MNFDPSKMTLEEMRAKLDELGIPHQSVGWSPAGGKTVQPPRIEKYKELLVKIRDLLEDQVEKDKAQISELHAILQRVKHGGGS